MLDEAFKDDIYKAVNSSSVMTKITAKASGKYKMKKAEDKLFAQVPEEFFAKKAKEVILNITGDKSLNLYEVNTIAESIYTIVDSNANIVLGAMIDEKLKNKVVISLILGIRDDTLF